MIIPSGTDIRVDVHGQLNIRTPGNLVIENSGNFGVLESLNGSIRIEPEAEVEAVEVQCADVCYVQGSLTAWKVSAHSLRLENRGPRQYRVAGDPGAGDRQRGATGRQLQRRQGAVCPVFPVCRPIAFVAALRARRCGTGPGRGRGWRRRRGASRSGRRGDRGRAQRSA